MIKDSTLLFLSWPSTTPTRFATPDSLLSPLEQLIRVCSVGSEVLLHSLEDQIAGHVNLVDGAFWQGVDQLTAFKLVVAPASLENLVLVLEAEVGVRVSGIDVFDIKIEHLIVRYDSWVAKVIDSRESLLRHDQAGGKELVQDRHGVGDVDDVVVLQFGRGVGGVSRCVN